MRARCMTEQEIAREVQVSQSVVSRDIKALNELSRQFIYNLAKSDLGILYKRCLDGLEEVKKECWSIVNFHQGSFKGEVYRIAALRLIQSTEIEIFRLLAEGPSVMTVKAMEEKLSEIEQSFKEANR